MVNRYRVAVSGVGVGGDRNADAARDLADWNAAGADIRVGDVILDINGQQIDETNVLANILTHFPVNDKVTLTVVRNSQTIKVPVTLTERP